MNPFATSLAFVFVMLSSLPDLYDNTYLDSMAFSPSGRPFNSLKVPDSLRPFISSFMAQSHAPLYRDLYTPATDTGGISASDTGPERISKSDFDSGSPSFPSMTRAKSSGVSMLFIGEKTL